MAWWDPAREKMKGEKGTKEGRGEREGRATFRFFEIVASLSGAALLLADGGATLDGGALIFLGSPLLPIRCHFSRHCLMALFSKLAAIRGQLFIFPLLLRVACCLMRRRSFPSSSSDQRFLAKLSLGEGDPFFDLEEGVPAPSSDS